VAHHRLTTAIECKDHTRPVDVPIVEAFASKCGRNLIDHKVIVSSSGFTGPARMKAAAVGIVCLELREVESFAWIAGAVFLEFRRDFGPFNIAVRATTEDDMPEGDVVKFVNKAGVEVEAKDLFQSMVNSLPSDNDEFAEPKNVLVHFTDLVAVIDSTGTRRSVVEASAQTSYTVTKIVKPYSLHHYTGEGLDKEIASTETQIDGAPARLMLIRSDAGIAVAVAPSGNTQQSG
jgi:hypothetical protein